MAKSIVGEPSSVSVIVWAVVEPSPPKARMFIEPTDLAPVEEMTQFWKPIDPSAKGPARGAGRNGEGVSCSKPVQFGL